MLPSKESENKGNTRNVEKKESAKYYHNDMTWAPRLIYLDSPLDFHRAYIFPFLLKLV